MIKGENEKYINKIVSVMMEERKKMETHIFIYDIQRKSVSTEKGEQRASPVVNRDNTNNTSSDDKAVTPEEQAYQHEKDRMYMMRHRLQKLVYQKKPVSNLVYNIMLGFCVLWFILYKHHERGKKEREIMQSNILQSTNNGIYIGRNPKG